MLKKVWRSSLSFMLLRPKYTQANTAPAASNKFKLWCFCFQTCLSRSESWGRLFSRFFFFNACILWYYLSEPLTSLSCSLNAVFPDLKMWDTIACANASFLTYFIISIVGLENVPPNAGFQKRATFSSLNVGLAWTGNWTRDTCVASSGTNCSDIHYTFSLAVWHGRSNVFDMPCQMSGSLVA
jgi:hypothetical protein